MLLPWALESWSTCRFDTSRVTEAICIYIYIYIFSFLNRYTHGAHEFLIFCLWGCVSKNISFLVFDWFSPFWESCWICQSIPRQSLPPRIASLNNFMKQRHKKSGRRGRAPQIMYTDRPDNPWKDRYLICEDCERLANYEEKPPRANCNNSTVLELDMTAPFSRDNCMVTSCEIVQMIKEDVWVLKDEDGRLAPSPHKREPAFPVQVSCFFFGVGGMLRSWLSGAWDCFFWGFLRTWRDGALKMK